MSKFSKRHLSRVINGDIIIKKDLTSPDRTRLDIITQKLYPDFSRVTIQKLIKDGAVKVDNQIINKPNFQLTGHEKISLKLPAKAKRVNLPIIYEDDHVLVVNKPAGLLTMSKGKLNLEPTVADFIGGAQNLVHRLDRNTSGILIASKDPETKSYLQKQFQARKTHKTYYAIVNGTPKLPEAVINLPIARNLKAPTTFRVDPSGREAITAYRIIRSDHDNTLLELKPTTGRTHQLRVHLSYIGTPIVGDTIYGVETAKNHQDTRMMLHAYSLEITIPSPHGGVRKTFIAPLPPEFDYAPR